MWHDEVDQWGDEVCYSPEADLIAGLVVGIIGIDALRHTDERRDLALAAVPVVLATHQLIEGVAWWGLQGQVPPDVGDLAVSAYLVVALGIVPVVVPYAVMRCEPASRRRATMLPFVVLGLTVSIVLLFGMVVGPHSAAIGGRYIAYETTTPGGGLTAGLYGIAVCAPFLMSSHRRLVLFGLANIPVLVLLSVLLSTGLISLWCIWAAAWSVVIAFHLRESSAAQFTSSSRAAAAS